MWWIDHRGQVWCTWQLKKTGRAVQKYKNVLLNEYVNYKNSKLFKGLSGPQR